LLKSTPAVGPGNRRFGKSEFSVEKEDGTELTFQVDEITRYRSKDKAELASPT